MDHNFDNHPFGQELTALGVRVLGPNFLQEDDPPQRLVAQWQCVSGGLPRQRTAAGRGTLGVPGSFGQ